MSFFDMRRLPGEWGLRADDSRAPCPRGCLTYALAPVDVVLFGVLSGALFGALAVAVRHGLSRGVPAEVGATVSAIVAFLVVGAIALVTGSFADPIDARDVLVFAAIGAGVPGLSQIAFVQSIRHAGAAGAVLIGVAPMLSFILAAIFLGEGINAGLVAGAALIVTAGASLSFERSKPPGYRAIGAVLAVLCAGLFAVRDTLVRWASGDATLDALVRTVVSLAAAAIVVGTWTWLTRARRPPVHVRVALRAFAPAGICLGVAYLCLIVALGRGRVTVVAPLNATQSLWGVIFAAALMGKREAVGPRLFGAAVLVVAGGVLIGISR
jgi:drug/metabolite transporter, DME family